MLDNTMHLVVTGTVSTVSKETCSYWIQSTPYVCGQYERMAVHACMDKTWKWKDPLTMLPCINSIITLDGILDHFDTYVPPNSKDRLTCAVVAIEDIILLQPIPNKKQDARDKIKTWRGKRKETETESPTSPPNIPQSSSAPHTSPMKIGKWKAHSLDDEVDDPSIL